ncbi:MAG: hypothetical protein ACREMP_09255 [Candidatus Tyrphobacter sp.]
MTALRLEAPPARIRNARTARTATQRRIARNAANRHASIRRIVAFVGALLVVALSYVLLVANITATSYAVDRAQAQRAALAAQVGRNDDVIASMTSDERLATVAAALGMVQPTQFVRVSLTRKPAPQSPLAFLLR